MKLQTSKIKKTLTQLIGLFIICSFILTGGMPGLAASQGQENNPFPTVELPAEALTIEATVLAGSRTASNSKLDSSLSALALAAEESKASALSLAESNQLTLSNGRVQAQITVNPDRVAQAVKDIEQEGGQVTGTGFEDTMIQAWLPVTSLQATAKSGAIDYIRRPPELVLDEVEATSEGLAVANGPAWHAAGFTGAGVKVAIIDGGFLGYTGLKGTDLPTNVIVKNFVDGQNDSQVDGTTKHGTACAEIVYDFAPEATMYLVKISTPLDLDEAVTWLRDTHNVDVISTSFSYFNQGPGDGTGYLANLVQGARDGGILWVKSAGNYREMHWGGPWSDSNDNSFLNFDESQEINFFGPGDGNTVYLIPNDFTMQVFMRWSDWTNVDQDYDLHLARWNGSEWVIVASSDDEQNGGPGQTPTEYIIYKNTGAPAAFGFLVEKWQGDQEVNFEILAPSTAHLDETVNARSLGDIGDAPAAMTVAALDVASPYNQEYYSSEGPTNGPGGIATGGATKPDISGFANVSTASYGPSIFNGTSSATPHVAGAATLALSAYPGYTPDQLQSFLEDLAIDMGPAGMDTQFGHGRLYLGNPPAPAGNIIYLPVSLKNFSSEPPDPPTLISPTDTSSTTDNTPTFEWNSSTGATSYHILVDNNSNFTSPEINEYTTATSFTPISTLNTDTYYWHVRAGSGGDQWSAWSSMWSFSISTSQVLIQNGDFEQGRTTWTESSSQGWILILNEAYLPEGVTPHNGEWIAWLGGDDDELSIIEQSLTVPTSTPYISYWHWINSGDICGNDYGGVMINSSTVVDVYDLCNVTSTGGWVSHSVNLSAYTGQTIDFQIYALTDAGLVSSLFIDDVTFTASALSVPDRQETSTVSSSTMTKSYFITPGE